MGGDRLMPKKKKKPQRIQPWSPFVPPTRPPTGSYDPALDSAEQAAGRGLGDFEQDTARENERASNDFLLAEQRLRQGRGYTDSDYGNQQSDLLTARDRANQDHDRTNQGLDRSYSRLAGNQRQSANAAGVLGGGFAAQAARKRGENRAYEQHDVDTHYGRINRDSATAEGRLGEDRRRALEGFDSQLGDLSLGYQRGGQDRGTALERSQREHGFFGLDTAESRNFQAAQSGYVPPTKPQGEGSRAGLAYRRIKRPGADVFALRSGDVIDRDDLLRRIRRRSANGA